MQYRPSLRCGLVGIVVNVVPSRRYAGLVKSKDYKRSDPTITTKNATGILILQVPRIMLMRGAILRNFNLLSRYILIKNNINRDPDGYRENSETEI